MEEGLQTGYSAGGILFSLLLLLAVCWIASRYSFFRLPPSVRAVPVTFFQSLGAFLIYLVFALIVLPIALALIAFIATGKIVSIKEFALPWMGWVQIISLTILFLLLVSYCYLIRPATRHYIFWGDGAQSRSRLLKSMKMGIAGLVVSYPFVLFISLSARWISARLWGDVEVEQVAVKQLKMTMDNPFLFSVMVLAVVVLVPFLEELLFRGFLQNLLKRYLGRVSAIVLTALIFAAVHFAPAQGIGNFQLILSLSALSFFLGFIYEKQQTLWAPITLHMAFNAFNIIFISFESLT